MVFFITFLLQIFLLVCFHLRDLSESVRLMLSAANIDALRGYSTLDKCDAGVLYRDLAIPRASLKVIHVC